MTANRRTLGLGPTPAADVERTPGRRQLPAESVDPGALLDAPERPAVTARRHLGTGAQGGSKLGDQGT